MLNRARAHPEPVGWVRGRAEQVPFVGGAFDLVFSVDVIHHVSGHRQLLCSGCCGFCARVAGCVP